MPSALDPPPPPPRDGPIWELEPSFSQVESQQLNLEAHNVEDHQKVPVMWEAS